MNELEKKSEEEKEREGEEDAMSSITSSSEDETVNFPGFSSVEKVSCYECGVSSASAKELTLINLQQLMKIGMRWICPLCLTCPSEVKLLKQELNEFKMSMKEELHNIKDCFNAKFDCLNTAQSVKKSTLGSLPTSNISHQTEPTMTHQIIVATDAKTPLTQKSFAEKVKENLKTVPVKNIRVAKDGCGIIDFPNQATRDEGISKLKNDFPVQSNNRPQRSVLPKITISDIQSCNYKNDDTEKLKEAICEKNPTLKSLVNEGKIFEILFIKEDPRHLNFSYAVAKVDKEVYDAIRLLKFQIYIDFGRCRVSDRFRVIQCYGCQKFGHVKNNCPLNAQNLLVCRYCCGNHDGKSCNFKGNLSKYKCSNCGSNHSSTYPGCQVLRNQVDFLAKRTQGLEMFTLSQLRRHTIIT